MSQRAILSVTAIAVAVFAVPAHAYTRPGATQRVSVSSAGEQGNGDSASDSGRVAMTPDGRYVVFTSAASNLVVGDGNGSTDIFVRDRKTERTEIASVASDGARGISPPVVCGQLASRAPAISADGRYVVFVSCFTNLVPGDTNLNADVFMHDMATGLTTRVSVASDEAQADNSSSYPSISADGRFVAFTSGASNLDPKTCPSDPEQQALCQSIVQGQLQGTSRVYVRDVMLGTTKLESVASNGDPADSEATYPVMSPDGHYVAFTSNADNLAANDKNVCEPQLPSCPDVFLHNLTSGSTELVSVGINGRSSTFGADSYDATAAISRDDRYVAFRSGSDDLVPNGRAVGIYLRDRKTGRTLRASVDSAGATLQMGYGDYALSPDGRFVAFDNAELMSSCSPQPVQTAVHDAVTGSIETEDRVNAQGGTNGCGNYYNSASPAVSADGRYVAFSTTAANLVQGDTNGKSDLFVRDRGLPLGGGQLAASGKLSVATAPTFPSTGMVAATDAVNDVDPPMTAQGANLIGASLTYRPQYADMFVRLALQQMPMFALANPALVYGLDLTAGSTRYQLRIAKTGIDASYQLFRLDAAGWVHAADLRGGYGTTGEEVVVALPLAAISAQRGAHLSNVVAFTGLGSMPTGSVHTLDQVTL